jgi:transposase-like protein
VQELVQEAIGVDEQRYRVAGLVRSHKRDGRANYDPAGKAALVRLAKSSVLSVPELARINGVNANLLGKWMHGGRNKRSSVIGKPLATPAKLLPIKLTMPVSTACTVEVSLPLGTLRLSGVDSALLTSLVKALAG